MSRLNRTHHATASRAVEPQRLWDVNRQRVQRAPHRHGPHLLILMLCLLTPRAAAESARSLYIGNSFTSYHTPHGIPGVHHALSSEDKAPGDALSTEQIAPGGYTLEQHLNDADGTTGDTTLRRWLVTGEDMDSPWDMVVLQEQSQIGGFVGRTDNDWQQIYWEQSLASIIKLDTLIANHGADTALMMTWGYRDGDINGQGRRNNAHIFPDYKTMQQKLAVGYETYAQSLSGPTRSVFIIPAGLAFERVYEDSSLAEAPSDLQNAFAALYSADGRHPSIEGSYLAGCVAYAALTGRDPRWSTWSPTAIAFTRAAYLRGVAADTVFSDASLGRAFPWGVERRYPFVHRWQSEVPDGTQHVTLSSTLKRPLWTVNGVVPPISTLSIGVSPPAGGIGAGWLELDEDARLSVNDRLTVGQSGYGQLILRGGTLITPLLSLAESVGAAGSLSITGGRAEVNTITFGQGQANFELFGGSLRAKTVEGPLYLYAGRWEVEPGGSVSGELTLDEGAELWVNLNAGTEPCLRASNDLTLRGTLVVQDGAAVLGDDTTSYTLLEAQEINTGQLEFELSAFADRTVSWHVEGSTTQRLILTIGKAPPPDLRPRESEDGIDDGDMSVEVDTASDIDQTPQEPTGGGGRGAAGGCAGSGSTGGWLGTIVWLLLSARGPALCRRSRAASPAPPTTQSCAL